MSDAKKVVVYLVGCTLTVLCLTAATKGDGPPKARSGASQIAAYDAGTFSQDGGAQPTKVFTALPGRNTFAIYNNGLATMYCSWSSNVTPSNGFPILAAGFLSVDITYNGSGDQDFYCIQTGADQFSPADTRWIQVK